jgi:hypothetical protein
VTPGERFAHMIETVFGLARLGYTNRNGMPHLLQLALFAQEFSDPDAASAGSESDAPAVLDARPRPTFG